MVAAPYKKHHFHLKMTVTATKNDSSHESGKNFTTWAWPTSTTIIYNNPVLGLNKIAGAQYYARLNLFSLITSTFYLL
jgi:hypothetical protein